MLDSAGCSQHTAKYFYQWYLAIAATVYNCAYVVSCCLTVDAIFALQCILHYITLQLFKVA